MPPSIPADALLICEAAARAGGRVLLDWVGRFGVSNKGPRDLVTEADLASQREIRQIVLGAFSDHGFIGEESLPEHAADGLPGSQHAAGGPPLRWMVDPLDGRCCKSWRTDLTGISIRPSLLSLRSSSRPCTLQWPARVLDAVCSLCKLRHVTISFTPVLSSGLSF